MVMKMNKKEKAIFYFILIVILIFIAHKLLIIKDLTYKVKSNDIKFNIKEKYTNFYSIEISNGKYIYPINIYSIIKENGKIVDEIYHYSDDKYECILPIIKYKVYTDFMCYKDNVIYNYNTIKGENAKLDKYVTSIKKYNNDYTNKDTYKEIDTLKFYDNKIDNIASITTYKGLYVNGMKVNLFKKDVYSNKISTFIDNYYLSADYNSNYEFKYFYLVNLKNSEIEKIESKESISFDSFIQGIVDNKVYIYDYDNEIQYEIDIYNKKINVVSSKDYIKYYTNRKWEKLSKSKVKRSTYFDYNTLDNNFTDYDIVKESNDYYYLINKNNDNYKIYRVNKSNINVVTYLGETPTLALNFNNDYFYYMYNNKLYFYSDKTGLKTILEDSEIEFNETIKYYIY